MIEFEDVRKRFGARGVEAVRGLSLKIAAGETVAFVGPNGAGKSTALSLALGFLRPTAGAIRIDGLAPRAFVRRRGAGYVPERFALPAAWRVRASLEHFARLGARAADASTRARTALEHFGLDLHAERRAGDLSHGLARRLALAIATVTPCPLVVLDEPTDGLDAEGRERFRERCAWLRASGTTLLLASQDRAEVARLADRAVVLAQGVAGDVVPLRAGAGMLAFRVELGGPFERFTEFFPGARPEAMRTAFHVQVRDAAELSARLRPLLDAGAIIAAVQPLVLEPGPATASSGGEPVRP